MSEPLAPYNTKKLSMAANAESAEERINHDKNLSTMKVTTTTETQTAKADEHRALEQAFKEFQQKCNAILGAEVQLEVEVHNVPLLKLASILPGLGEDEEIYYSQEIKNHWLNIKTQKGSIQLNTSKAGYLPF